MTSHFAFRQIYAFRQPFPRQSQQVFQSPVPCFTLPSPPVRLEVSGICAFFSGWVVVDLCLERVW